MSKSPANLEVLPPEKGLSAPQDGQKCKFALLESSPLYSEESIVAVIKGDLDACERHTRAAAFLAMRVGIALVWVRDNGKHGDLTPFIEKNFTAFSRRTLFNYIRVADQFLKDCNLKDGTVHKLNNAGAIAPILEEQLELFITPEAPRPDAIKLAVDWVNKRGLCQIYKDIAANHEADMPPSQEGNTPQPKRSALELARERAMGEYSAFKRFISSDEWGTLLTRELVEMEKTLRTSQQRVAEVLKEREQAKKGKPAKSKN